MKCECGGEIVFENKKTFTVPDVKRGVCIMCAQQYILTGGKLSKKEG